MFSLVWGPMLCHLGCSHPRTPLPDLKQIKSVFCHLHMLYRVEHMVMAHLTHLLNAIIPTKGGRCQGLHFVHFCLSHHPSQALYKFCSTCASCSASPSMPWIPTLQNLRSQKGLVFLNTSCTSYFLLSSYIGQPTHILAYELVLFCPIS